MTGIDDQPPVGFTTGRTAGEVWVETCVKCGRGRWVTTETTGTPCYPCEQKALKTLIPQDPTEEP